MAHNEIVVEGSMADVWNVVGDPRAYGYFVPGTRRIREFDARWPDPGSRIRHTLGLEPLVIRDESVVHEAVPPRVLRIEASMGPLGAAEVIFRIEPEGDGRARLVLDEHPARGLLKATWNPLFEALLQARNELSVRRVKAQVEGHRDRHGRPTTPDQARPRYDPAPSVNGRG